MSMQWLPKVFTPLDVSHILSRYNHKHSSLEFSGKPKVVYDWEGERKLFVPGFVSASCAWGVTENFCSSQKQLQLSQVRWRGNRHFQTSPQVLHWVLVWTLTGPLHTVFHLQKKNKQTFRIRHNFLFYFATWQKCMNTSASHCIISILVDVN